MSLSNVTPVKVGNKYLARVSKPFKYIYLTTTSKGLVIECGIELAKELDTVQEVIDLGYAYFMGSKYPLL